MLKIRDPRKKCRCNCNSKELRKTHYTLGRDCKNYIYLIIYNIFKYRLGPTYSI